MKFSYQYDGISPCFQEAIWEELSIARHVSMRTKFEQSCSTDYSRELRCLSSITRIGTLSADNDCISTYTQMILILLMIDGTIYNLNQKSARHERVRDRSNDWNLIFAIDAWYGVTLSVDILMLHILCFRSESSFLQRQSEFLNALSNSKNCCHQINLSCLDNTQNFYFQIDIYSYIYPTSNTSRLEVK